MSHLESPGPPPVGPTQREAAVAALVVHREAGRLDSVEFENRQMLADAAQSWADIDRLFADLPAPHPQRPMPPVPVGAPPTVTGSVGGPVGRSGGIAWVPGLQAAVPILAVILYVFTKQWVVFLLIPLAMIFIKGPGRRR
jgi:hypothetical protein